MVCRFRNGKWNPSLSFSIRSHCILPPPRAIAHWLRFAQISTLHQIMVLAFLVIEQGSSIGSSTLSYHMAQERYNMMQRYNFQNLGQCCKYSKQYHPQFQTNLTWVCSVRLYHMKCIYDYEIMSEESPQLLSFQLTPGYDVQYHRGHRCTVIIVTGVKLDN